MTLYDKRRNKLINDLKDKKYRDAYVEESVRVGIPFQIRTIRNGKKLKQEELGKLAGMKQEAICRLEDPNYGSFTLKTLNNIAAAFDVGLIVRFAPFSELVKWDLNLSANSLDIPSYNNDTYFQESNGEDVIESGESPRYKMEDVQVAPAKVFYFKDHFKKNDAVSIDQLGTTVPDDALSYHMNHY